MRKTRLEQLEQEKSDLEDMQEYYRNTYGLGSEEEKRIIELIKKHEEAIASENAQIEKNTKIYEENQKKIRQVQKTLEDAVDKEIEAEKKRQREILSANVSMQDTILNLLKKRLQDEWNLKKKDIEKEKESLNEYKKLINERFNYRKKASDQADKDEELADYRRQLALIEADPSRTKDAKELRRQIEELERDQTWAIAEDELNNENERIDEQTQGWDKYVQYNEEKLNELLSDANNFATELNDILSGSFEESYEKILDFMNRENEAFMKSLPDAQKQMIQSWEDTWKKAKDIVDSNYEQIKAILESKESFMAFMKETDRTYKKYLDDNDANSMKLLEKQWEELYDKYVNATKDTATFTPDEHILEEASSQIEELVAEMLNVDTKDIISNAPEAEGFSDNTVKTQDLSTGESLIVSDLNDIYKKVEPIAADVAAIATATGAKSSSTPKQKKEEQVVISVIGGNGSNPGAVTSYIGYGKTKDDAYKNAKEEAESKRPGGYIVSSDYIPNDEKSRMLHYANGGLVDFTGPAWVDGTKTKPESFLDSTDTSILRSMLDTFTYIKNSPYMSYIDPSMYGNNTNVGDINITINQAELKSDADIDNLARKIGKSFTKEMQKQGLNLSGYTFG